MRAPFALAICTLLASACAGVDCQATDWRSLGERDGVLGAQGQDGRYAGSCGNAFDAARYREGFQDGFARRPRPVV
jgi:hypothetical protein